MAFPNISVIGNVILDELRAYDEAADKGEYVDGRVVVVFNHYIPDDIPFVPDWLDPTAKGLLRNMVTYVTGVLHGLIIKRQESGEPIPLWPSAIAPTIEYEMPLGELPSASATTED